MATIETRLIQTGSKDDGSPLTRAVYRVKIRLKGHAPQTATFARRTDAKHWAQETESALRNGRYFKSTEAKKHTMNELLDRYEKEAFPQLAPSTQYVRKIHFKWWRAKIGHMTISEVTPATISEAKAALANGTKKRLAPATVVHHLASLSHAFTVAVREWFWAEENPLEKVQKPRVNNGRVRFLDEGERERLLNSCRASKNPYLHTVVLIALSTGARKSEILSLKWSDVDLERNQVTFRETKNGETRTVPLAKQAQETLKEHARIRRLNTPLVFPGQVGNKAADIRNDWELAREKAGITNFRFHDLRHSCASYLAMSGATTHEIMAVLGHKSPQMAKRYAHIGEQHTASVINRMSEKFL